MVRRIKMGHFILAAVAGTLLVFQNCSSNMSDQAADVSSTSYQEGLPFAYKARPDTIAYMSCGRMKYDNWPASRYFSFRVGAYKTDAMGRPSLTSGLGLTSEFLDKTKNFSLEQRARAFAASKLSADTVMQLSIRSASNFQLYYYLGSDALVEGRNADNFLDPSLKLDLMEITGHLTGLKTNEYLNYFPGDTPKRLMEASLRFLEHEVTSRDLRNRMNSSEYILSLAYPDTPMATEKNLRGPNGVTPNNIYGNRFNLTFTKSANFASGENRLLTGVTEIDMQTGKMVTDAPWDCRANLRLQVIRPEDLAQGRPAFGRVATVVDPSPNKLSATAKEQLELIRRVLRSEDWWVDLNTMSIVPRYANVDYCYGDRTGRPTINYWFPGDVAKACTGENETLGTLDSCPHYVSICVR